MVGMLGAQDYSVLDWIQFSVSILSLFGIVAIYAWARHVVGLKWRAHWILRFKSSRRVDHPLSIVISTSEKHNPQVAQSSPKFWEKRRLCERSSSQESNGPKYPRPTVSVWTTYAVTEITEVASKIGYRKSFEADIAERVTHNQMGDLVLIGGRIKNIRSRQFSEHFNSCYPELAITRSLDGSGETKKLKIGNEEFNFTPRRDLETGHTVSDRAILVLWRNPFHTGRRRRRGILCAGFTSMGTAGAAQYLSDSIQSGSLRRLWKLHRPNGWFYRRFPQFIVVLDVYVNNDRYLDVYPVKLIPIIENGPTGRRIQIHGRDATVGH